ncbi:MAG TPA: TIGR02147 family protein [Fibrobacteraceae bacterium]|nr:TIGR02147 family protein [Fibrobacteraceae bacterium]
MESLYQSLDYREFLKAHYEMRKQENRYFSYRVFANAVGMDQSHLAKILMGHLHLPLEKITAFCAYFKFSGTAVEYFESLVRFGRATTPAEAKTWFEKLQAIRPPKFRCLPADQFEYFAHWHTPVVRALVGILESADAQRIAANMLPPISVKDARQSLEIIRRLALIRETPEGPILSEPHIGSGRAPRSPVLRDYHRQVLLRTLGALEDIPVEERDVSTLTVGLDESAFDDIRSMIRDFRMAIQKRIDQVQEADRAYLINFQLIPVSKTKQTKDNP